VASPTRPEASVATLTTPEPLSRYRIEVYGYGGIGVYHPWTDVPAAFGAIPRQPGRSPYNWNAQRQFHPKKSYLSAILD
jgi:hypothetical protein